MHRRRTSRFPYYTEGLPVVCQTKSIPHPVSKMKPPHPLQRVLSSFLFPLEGLSLANLTFRDTRTARKPSRDPAASTLCASCIRAACPTPTCSCPSASHAILLPRGQAAALIACVSLGELSLPNGNPIPRWAERLGAM